MKILHTFFFFPSPGKKLCSSKNPQTNKKLQVLKTLFFLKIVVVRGIKKEKVYMIKET